MTFQEERAAAARPRMPKRTALDTGPAASSRFVPRRIANRGAHQGVMLLVLKGNYQDSAPTRIVDHEIPAVVV
jgi:hypothetical protein